MSELLTTRQLMDLLQLDRTTIYRMLNEGRLPAVRVGGQWRFSRQAIDLWLQEQNRPAETPAAAPSPTASVPTSDMLPLHCLEPIQDVFAQTAEIGAVTTDVEGRPLTRFSNSCAFCNLILSTEKGRAACQASWKRLGAANESPPRLETCHAGLTYARGRITVQNAFIAMFFSGQFALSGSSPIPSRKQLAAVAEACEVSEPRLVEAAQDIRVVDRARAERLLNLLQTVAETFSIIGQERVDLLSRLQKVAEIAGGTAA